MLSSHACHAAHAVTLQTRGAQGRIVNDVVVLASDTLPLNPITRWDRRVMHSRGRRLRASIANAPALPAEVHLEAMLAFGVSERDAFGRWLALRLEALKCVDERPTGRIVDAVVWSALLFWRTI
jgi:hypothetical protein